MIGVITPSMDNLARLMKTHAETGLYYGQQSDMHRPYFHQATRVHDKTGTRLIFTRDIGHHSSGWFKNPDYERCYHLSLSFFDPETHEDAPFNSALAKLWVHAFYGDNARLVWEEGQSLNQQTLDQMIAPATQRLRQIKHFRVFCDPKWRLIKPRGEVYTREFIEKGWKSWSDQNYERSKLVGR